MSVDYIIPHFNCSNLAIRAVKSLLNQNGSHLKNIFIVDDGSDEEDLINLETQLKNLQTNVKLHLIKSKVATEHTLKFGNYIATSSVIVRNRDLPKFQNLYYDDYIFWITMCLQGKQGIFSESYCYYSVRKGSLSYNKFKSMKKHFESLKKSGHYSTQYSIFLTLIYIYNGILKYAK